MIFKLTLSFGNIPAKANIKSKKTNSKIGYGTISPLAYNITFMSRSFTADRYPVEPRNESGHPDFSESARAAEQDHRHIGAIPSLRRNGQKVNLNDKKVSLVAL